MAYDIRFGPNAQTPTQRAWVLKQMQTYMSGLKSKTADSPHAQELYARYVAGELSWLEVRQALALAP